MMQYKFATEEDKDEPVGKRMINKEGKEVKKIKANFTLNDVENQKASFEKTVKEKEGQMRIHQAEMANVTKNHPEVLTIPEKVKQAVYVYVKAKIEYETNKSVKEAYEDAIKDTVAELNEIKTQLNVR